MRPLKDCGIIEGRTGTTEYVSVRLIITLVLMTNV